MFPSKMIILKVIITAVLISVNGQAVPDSNQDDSENNYLIKVLSNTVLNSQSEISAAPNKKYDAVSEMVVSLVQLVNNEAGVDLIVISDNSLKISPSAIGELLKTYTQAYIKNQYKNKPFMAISVTITTNNRIKEIVTTLENVLGNTSLPLKLANQAGSLAKSYRAISIPNILRPFLKTLLEPIQANFNNILNNVTTILESFYTTVTPTNPILAMIANTTNTLIDQATDLVKTVQSTVNNFFSELLNGTSTSSTSNNTTRQVSFNSRQEVSFQRANVVSNIFKNILSFVVGIIKDFIDSYFNSITTLLKAYYIAELPSNPIAAAIANVTNKVVLFAEARVTAVQEIIDGFFTRIMDGGSSNTTNTTNTTGQVSFESESFELSQQDVLLQRANGISNVFRNIVSYVVELVQGIVDSYFEGILSLLKGYYVVELPSNPIAAAIANILNNVIQVAEARLTAVQKLVDNIFSNIVNGGNSSNSTDSSISNSTDSSISNDSISSNSTGQLQYSSGGIKDLNLFGIKFVQQLPLSVQ